MRTLPPFDRDDTDGCSLAPFLPARLRPRFQRQVLKIIAKGRAQEIAMHAACVIHDEWYYYGGTRKQRKEGDLLVRQLWKLAGAPLWFREMGYRAIRLFGGPGKCCEGVSWAYGGSFFQYGVRAVPDEEIGPSEAAQGAQDALYEQELWPFNEPRCDCPEDVVCSVLTLDHKPYGMVCEGCGKEYTEIKLL
jgi:hypothetical protein